MPAGFTVEVCAKNKAGYELNYRGVEATASRGGPWLSILIRLPLTTGVIFEKYSNLQLSHYPGV